MLKKSCLALLATALVAGCGTQTAQTMAPRTAGAVQAASTDKLFQAAIDAFDRLPSTGVKRLEAPTPQASVSPPPNGAPLTVVKIQSLAAGALSDASEKATFPERYGITHNALVAIDEVKFSDKTITNVAAKMGIYSALGYGYVGFKPTPENRFKVQATVLSFLKRSNSELGLAKGAGLFTLGREMLKSTTDCDQGFRVGIGVLAVIKEKYGDKEVTKTVTDILKKACAAPTKEAAFYLMCDGLTVMSEKFKN